MAENEEKTPEVTPEPKAPEILPAMVAASKADAVRNPLSAIENNFVQNLIVTAMATMDSTSEQYAIAKSAHDKLK